jgi:hypothetical protein
MENKKLQNKNIYRVYVQSLYKHKDELKSTGALWDPNYCGRGLWYYPRSRDNIQNHVYGFEIICIPCMTTNKSDKELIDTTAEERITSNYEYRKNEKSKPVAKSEPKIKPKAKYDHINFDSDSD